MMQVSAFWFNPTTRLQYAFKNPITNLFPESATAKVKETMGVKSGEASGKASEVTGQAKGKASELAGEAKGKAAELKGEAKSKM